MYKHLYKLSNHGLPHPEELNIKIIEDSVGMTDICNGACKQQCRLSEAVAVVLKRGNGVFDGCCWQICKTFGLEVV